MTRSITQATAFLLAALVTAVTFATADHIAQQRYRQADDIVMAQSHGGGATALAAAARVGHAV